MSSQSMQWPHTMLNRRSSFPFIVYRDSLNLSLNISIFFIFFSNHIPIFCCSKSLKKGLFKYGRWSSHKHSIKATFQICFKPNLFNLRQYFISQIFAHPFRFGGNGKSWHREMIYGRLQYLSLVQVKKGLSN